MGPPTSIFYFYSPSVKSFFGGFKKRLSAAAIVFVCFAPGGLHGGETDKRFHRRYAATAYISVLGLPIFSRQSVGYGEATAEERVAGDERSVSLRFLGASTPERAHGLNRFGLIQENVVQRNHATVEADYFGLMTASGEDSLSAGKAALKTKLGAQVPFVAAKAEIDPQRARYSVRHMLLPASFRGTNADELLGQVEGQFATPRPDLDKVQPLRGQAIGTFLFSLRQATQDEAANFDGRFIYNGKTFRLHTEKHPNSGAIVAMNATIRNEKTGEITGFKLWFDRSSANFLPLRFEFKPKSYLRLVFEAEGEAANSTVSLNTGGRP